MALNARLHFTPLDSSAEVDAGSTGVPTSPDVVVFQLGITHDQSWQWVMGHGSNGQHIWIGSRGSWVPETHWHYLLCGGNKNYACKSYAILVTNWITLLTYLLVRRMDKTADRRGWYSAYNATAADQHRSYSIGCPQVSAYTIHCLHTVVFSLHTYVFLLFTFSAKLYLLQITIVLQQDYVVSDIAVFVLTRDVKLHPTNLPTNRMGNLLLYPFIFTNSPIDYSSPY